ncbi:hypothetical protein Dsin_000067 [Dipteronia sinensis]|uniref:C2H2-type domain-containing protein n=1 Tax=Dipteronia sinensis TaxID=43782 RepID=A0AAD9Z461_9ROSI|nr:hypothetical protein Dsin_000067 [Dipteronia sinensis]
MFSFWLLIMKMLLLMYLILLQRVYSCQVNDCHASYRRKDHLTRHLLQHQGTLFKYPIEKCNSEFSFQGNIKRHLKEIHDEDSSITIPKHYVCQETGCAKVFKYASKLRKHEVSCQVRLCGGILFRTRMYEIFYK